MGLGVGSKKQQMWVEERMSFKLGDSVSVTGIVASLGKTSSVTNKRGKIIHDAHPVYAIQFDDGSKGEVKLDDGVTTMTSLNVATATGPPLGPPSMTATGNKVITPGSSTSSSSGSGSSTSSSSGSGSDNTPPAGGPDTACIGGDPKSLLHMVPDGLIHFGGKTYDIRYTKADQNRRSSYSFSEQEAKLLKDIGLVEGSKSYAYVKDKLPAFFNELPCCQTNAALSLSSKCDTPRSVIETVLKEKEYTAVEKYKEDMKRPSPTLDFLAKEYNLVSGLRKLISGPAPSAKTVKTSADLAKEGNDIFNLFLLRI